jgi:hypothetical protein
MKCFSKQKTHRHTIIGNFRPNVWPILQFSHFNFANMDSLLTRMKTNDHTPRKSRKRSDFLHFSPFLGGAFEIEKTMKSHRFSPLFSVCGESFSFKLGRKEVKEVARGRSAFGSKISLFNCKPLQIWCFF